MTSPHNTPATTHSLVKLGVTKQGDMMTSPSPVVKRHSRALRILCCLQSGPSFNARELAQRLRVSRRTIYRDLELIRAAGIDVVFDETSDAYRVNTHRNLLPASLQPEDLTRLMVTSQLSPFAAMSADFEVSVRESMSRLLGPYPDEIRVPIQRILNACRVRPADDQGKHQSDLLQRIMVGVGRAVQLELAVESRTGSRDSNGDAKLEQIRFAPYQIETDGRQWRLIGRVARERRRREIYLDDIHHVELTNVPYSTPRQNRCRSAASA